MLFHSPPIWPTSGSGSQPGQYTGALIRSARRCQPAGCAQVAFAGFAAGAASAFFASPQPDASSAHNPRSREIVRSPLTGAMVARFRSDVRRAMADELADLTARDEDGVDAGPLERQHLVARGDVQVGDGELPRGHVRQ